MRVLPRRIRVTGRAVVDSVVGDVVPAAIRGGAHGRLVDDDVVAHLGGPADPHPLRGDRDCRRHAQVGGGREERALEPVVRLRRAGGGGRRAALA